MSIERKDAELAVMKAEADFVEKKQAGELTDEDRHQLRALRQEYRADHRQPVKDGASPDPINANAKAEEV